MSERIPDEVLERIGAHHGAGGWHDPAVARARALLGGSDA